MQAQGARTTLPLLATRANHQPKGTLMNRTEQAPHPRPDAIHSESETNPNSDGERRWYQARPGSRGSVHVLGEDYPWWLVPLVILLIII